MNDVLNEATVTVSDDEVNETASLIAAGLRVWIVEAEDGKRDHRAVLDRLGDLVPGDQPEAAHSLFLHLVDIAQTLGPRAGGINRQKLVAELQRRQVRLIGDGVPGSYAAASVTNLPLRNRAFTGRDLVLDRMAAELAEKPGTIVAAYGLGGVGKTQVALEYAHRHRGEYSLMWWVRAESDVAIASDIAALGERIGIPAVGDQVETVAAVKAALADRRDWLLVFDNAANPPAIDRYIPGGGGHVVITSRTRDWSALATPIHVEVMTPPEALAYLHTRTERDDLHSAAELSEQLGYLPLALAQAGGYIAAYGTSITGYLKLFREATARLLAAGPTPVGYPETVATTWLLHFEALARERPAAVDLLNLCAFLAPDMIPISLLLDAAPPDSLVGPLGTAAADAMERDSTVGALVATSLFDRIDDETISVHRLVQEITRAKLASHAQQKWALCAASLLLAAFPSEPERPQNWAGASGLTVHGLTATERVNDCGAVPTKDSADLLNAMGIHLSSRADLTSAEDLYNRAITMKQATYGVNHAEVAVTLDNLGLLLTRKGDAASACHVHERALAIKLASGGPNHPSLAVTFTNLAAALDGMGDHAAALQHLLQALAIDEAAYGPSHPEVASVLRDIGINLVNLGDPAAALAPLQRALTIYQDVYGPEDTQVGQTLDALGHALNRVGAHDTARDSLQRALAITEAAYGPDHPQTARTLTNLGDALDDLGDHQPARVHLERALTIVETAFGPNHPDVGRILLTLSVVLDNLGDRRPIQPYRQRAYGILHAALGPDHPHTRLAALGLDAAAGSAASHTS